LTPGVATSSESNPARVLCAAKELRPLSSRTALAPCINHFHMYQQRRVVRMPAQVTLSGISEVFDAADIEYLVRTAGEAVCGDVDDLSSRQRALAEQAYALAQADDTIDPSAELVDEDDVAPAPARHPALVTREYPLGSTAHPETVRAKDAEIRIYNQDSGTDSDDASDMYVMEVLA
jgi:hypothetical protein